MPRVDAPVYNATKAAVRSFTISLRHQLQDTDVRVIELIPPAVQSELHNFLGAGGREVIIQRFAACVSAQGSRRRCSRLAMVARGSMPLSQRTFTAKW